MVEVDPLADVPRTDPIGVGELFQSGRKPTDTEIPPATGNVASYSSNSGIRLFLPICPRPASGSRAVVRAQVAPR